MRVIPSCPGSSVRSYIKARIHISSNKIIMNHKVIWPIISLIFFLTLKRANGLTIKRAEYKRNCEVLAVSFKREAILQIGYLL